MQTDGGSWFADLGPFTSGVQLTLQAEAFDVRGASATRRPLVVTIDACGPEG